MDHDFTISIVKTVSKLGPIWGALVVLGCSWQRFNTPPTNRASTTARNFMLGALIYATILLTAYSVLLVSPKLRDAIEAMQQDTAQMDGALREGSNPLEKKEIKADEGSAALFAALILTVFLPTIRPLSTLDDWVRRRIWRAVNIPQAAVSLAEELSKMEWKVPNEQRQKILDDSPSEILDNEISVSDVPFAMAWTKLVSLMFLVKHWVEQPRLQGFIANYQEELTRISNAFEALASKIGPCVALEREIRVPGDGVLEEVGERYLREFQRETLRLLDDLYLFMSRGLLRSNLTEDARRLSMRQLGFYRVIIRRPIANVMALVLAIIGILMLLGAIYFGTVHQVKPPQFWILLFRICMIYGTAILIAVVLKDWFLFARASSDGARPYAAYVLSGALAFFATRAVSLFFLFLAYPDLPSAWAMWCNELLYGLMPAATAVGVSVLCDNKMPGTLSGRRRLALLEGSIQAIVTMGAYAIVMQLSTESSITQQEPKIPNPNDAFFLFGGIGFVIGLMIPSWYRGPVVSGSGSEVPDRLAA